MLVMPRHLADSASQLGHFAPNLVQVVDLRRPQSRVLVDRQLIITLDCIDGPLGVDHGGLLTVEAPPQLRQAVVKDLPARNQICLLFLPPHSVVVRRLLLFLLLLLLRSLVVRRLLCRLLRRLFQPLTLCRLVLHLRLRALARRIWWSDVDAPYGILQLLLLLTLLLLLLTVLRCRQPGYAGVFFVLLLVDVHRFPFVVE